MKQFAVDRDWLQFHSPKNLSMAIGSEAAELMELFLWCDSEDSKKIASEEDMKHRVGEEMADVLLFLLQLSNITGVDLAEATRQKLVKNEQKYPVSLAKGSSKKYNEL